MSMFGADPLFWRAVRKVARSVAAKEFARVVQVEVAEVIATGPDAGKIKVYDETTHTIRDVPCPQTNPAHVPAAGDWMWALSKEGGLLLLSP